MTNAFFDSNWDIGDAVDLQSLRRTGAVQGKDYPIIPQSCNHLIKAMTEGKSVVYLGAGASVASGLPDWKTFLYHLLDEAKGYSKDAAKSISERISKGDLLVAAEMLQNLLGTNLQEVTHRVFGKARVPTAIHNAIATVPFSLSITTNYDSLAEFAYEYPVRRLTWQNPYDLLQNLRAGIFCVLKLHGDYSVRKSIVLTRTNYRELMQLNEMLLNCLRMLLATRCFLFVGVSFSDPDLLALMDEAKALYGDAFGPHFAIFPYEFYDTTYSEVLLKSYNIHSIIAPPIEDSTKRVDPITNGVASVISHLGGHVALEGRRTMQLFGAARHHLDANSPPMLHGERMHVGWLLMDLVSRLGLVYGEVCLIHPQKSEQRIIYRTVSYRSSQPQADYFGEHTEAIAPNSLQNRVFMQRKIEEDFAIVSDTISLDSQGFAEALYEYHDIRSSSALVVPIYVDGKRSGVLVLEAKSGVQFSKLHYEVIREYAVRIGNIRYEANRTFRLATSLRQYGEKLNNFRDFLSRSRDLLDIGLDCLVYQIDPYRSMLVAPLTDDELAQQKGSKTWSYPLDKMSLASAAFNERRTVREPRPENLGPESNSSKLAMEGRNFFNISGPVVAFPINVGGNTAGIFVGWSKHALATTQYPKKPNKDRPGWRMVFWRAIERAKRMLHLLANEPIPDDGKSRAESFLETIADGLKDIDHGENWRDQVSTEEFRRKVIDHLLKSLTAPCCGLKRSRFFVLDGVEKPIGVICTGSYNSPNSVKPLQCEVNYYRGRKIPFPDPYVSYTITRSEFDPYARVQDSATVFGIPDPSIKLLDKPSGASWLVAPVGPQTYDRESGNRIGMKTFGYLAADNFVWDPSTHEMKVTGSFIEQTSEVIFQRFCMDFVADLLSILVENEAKKPSAVLRNSKATRSSTLAKAARKKTVTKKTKSIKNQPAKKSKRKRN